MTSEEFKNQLKNPKNVYCLVSTDSKMIDLYIKRFKEAIQADNIIYGKIDALGKLFKRKTLCVLYKDKLTEDLFTRPEYIFIHTDTIDKRTAIYKKYKDQIIELSNNYVGYITKNSNMNDEEAKIFAKMCNNDLGIIEHRLYIYNLTNMTFKDISYFEDYSSDSLLWVEKYIKNEPLPSCKESPISVMALLSVNCQNLVRILQNNTSGMNPYMITQLSMLKSYRNEEELKQIIKLCFYLDCQIKKGSFDINDTYNYLKAFNSNTI